MIHGCLLHLAFHHGMSKFHAWLRSDVGCDAYYTVCPFLHKRESLIIIAAEHKEAFRTALNDFENLPTVAGGLLDGDYIVYLRKTQSGFRCHVGSGTSRHIIKDYRGLG